MEGRRVRLWLLGAGGVGRALIRQILDLRDFHAERFSLVFDLQAIADSRGLRLAESGAFDDRQLRELIDFKASGGSLADAAAGALDRGAAALETVRPGSIVVDCSASAATGNLLAKLVGRGVAVATANKKPLTQSQSMFEAIAGPERPPRLSRWESTVGAGLPVIASLNRLYACGDRVDGLTGSLSSTLGFLMAGLQSGRRFSQLVDEVMRAGYTEPDPREDLGGVDVARKAVIMARTLGWKCDLDRVRIDRLYPEEMDSLSVTDFMHQLPRLDADFAARAQAALRQGSVLRYAVTVTPAEIAVGVTETPLDSPLGRLTGTNQIVEVRSRWYNPNPLVIQGRGAGVDATAAGVLADLVELALSRPEVGA